MISEAKVGGSLSSPPAGAMSTPPPRCSLPKTILSPKALTSISARRGFSAVRRARNSTKRTNCLKVSSPRPLNSHVLRQERIGDFVLGIGTGRLGQQAVFLKSRAKIDCFLARRDKYLKHAERIARAGEFYRDLPWRRRPGPDPLPPTNPQGQHQRQGSKTSPRRRRE